MNYHQVNDFIGLAQQALLDIESANKDPHSKGTEKLWKIIERRNIVLEKLRANHDFRKFETCEPTENLRCFFYDLCHKTLIEKKPHKKRKNQSWWALPRLSKQEAKKVSADVHFFTHIATLFYQQQETALRRKFTATIEHTIHTKKKHNPGFAETAYLLELIINREMMRISKINRPELSNIVKFYTLFSLFSDENITPRTTDILWNAVKQTRNQSNQRNYRL